MMSIVLSHLNLKLSILLIPRYLNIKWILINIEHCSISYICLCQPLKTIMFKRVGISKRILMWRLHNIECRTIIDWHDLTIDLKEDTHKSAMIHERRSNVLLPEFMFYMYSRNGRLYVCTLENRDPLIILHVLYDRQRNFFAKRWFNRIQVNSLFIRTKQNS